MLNIDDLLIEHLQSCGFSEYPHGLDPNHNHDGVWEKQHFYSVVFASNVI